MHTQLYPSQVAFSQTRSLSPIPSPGVATCETCIETLYPSAEITSQCTDRCIIIACNNPDHSEVNQCHGTDDVPCDFVCDGASHCNDCVGFDELFQCCTNYHPYPSFDQISNTSSSWDPSPEKPLCSCTESGTIPGYHAANSIGLVETISNTPRDEPIQPTPPLSPSITSYFSLPPHNPHPELMTCMWGICQASFTSMAELVGHVNLEHLRLPSSPAQHTSPSDVYPDAFQLACQWRDCSSHLLPDSSTHLPPGNQVDELLNYLANHLLNEHLGLHDDTPGSNMIVDNASTSSQTSAMSVHFSPTSSDDSSIDGCAYTCDWQTCGLSFGKCDDLTTHITDVHIGGGKAQYECFWKGCNRNGDNGFSSKQKICRHLQSHTGHRPFQCNTCHQYFSEAATLQQHMRRHTQEKPYTCDYPGCGKTFAITGALTIHKRIHNGQKPFKCKFCEKAFAESSNLSKHLRTHTGARPYSCTEPGCSKSFARPDQLTRHLGVHKKKTHSHIQSP